MESLTIDFKNHEYLVELMNNHEKYPTALCGMNADEENIFTSICPDYVCVETWQNNGWIRFNYIWRDGTREEMFKGRWDKNRDEEIVEEVDLSDVPTRELVKELNKRGVKVR